MISPLSMSAVTPPQGSEAPENIGEAFGQIMAKTLVDELAKVLPEAEMALGALELELAQLLQDDLWPKAPGAATDDPTEAK